MKDIRIREEIVVLFKMVGDVMPIGRYWFNILFIERRIGDVWKWLQTGEGKEGLNTYNKYFKSWREPALIVNVIICLSLVGLSQFFSGFCMGVTQGKAMAFCIVLVGITVSLWSISLYFIWKMILINLPFWVGFLPLIWSILSLAPWVPSSLRAGNITDHLINLCVGDFGIQNINNLHVWYIVGHWAIVTVFTLLAVYENFEKIYVCTSLHYMGIPRFKRTNFYRHLVQYENRNFELWQYAREFSYGILNKIPFIRHFHTKIMKDLDSLSRNYLLAKSELVYDVQGFQLDAPKKC